MSPQAPSRQFLKALTWGDDGHGTAVYLLALAVGYAPPIATQLASASLLPDHNRQLSAIWVAVTGVTRWRWRQAVMGSLHSLHGMDAEGVAYRQTVLARLASEALTSGDHLMAGLVLHALGDAFAHVRPDGSAYGPLVGHLFAGTAPDRIEDHENAFTRYMTTLHTVLLRARQAREPNAEDRVLLQQVIQRVRAWLPADARTPDVTGWDLNQARCRVLRLHEACTACFPP